MGPNQQSLHTQNFTFLLARVLYTSGKTPPYRQAAGSKIQFPHLYFSMVCTHEHCDNFLLRNEFYLFRAHQFSPQYVQNSACCITVIFDIKIRKKKPQKKMCSSLYPKPYMYVQY